jgi:hypothetical protein
MDMGRFLNKLKRVRRDIVTQNWPQIFAYLEELRQREAMRNVGDGWHLDTASFSGKYRVSFDDPCASSPNQVHDIWNSPALYGIASH